MDVRPESGTPAQRLTGTAGTGFGSAVATAYVDQDSCLDLAVGAPEADGRGSVQIFLGGQQGFTTPAAVTLSGRGAGEQFGAHVAVRERAQGGVDVWVGAPRRAVAGRTKAGAVDHFVVAPDGASQRVETVTAAQASGGAAQKSAEFGRVFAATAEGMAVGVPREDVAGRADAGAVYWFPLTTDTDLVGRGTVWSQNSRGVPGGSEKGDHFGAAVAFSAHGSPRWVLVGAPDENIGRSKDAGSVQSFTLAPGSRSLVPGLAMDETHARIPGSRTAAGNRFGAAVAVHDGSCLSGGWIVGAPGTDAGGKKDAGAFSTVAPPDTSCRSTRFTQRSLSQHDETGDRFGATLSTLGEPKPDAPMESQLVLIGAPGEDASNGTKDVGSVTSFWRSEQKDEQGRPVLTPMYQYFSYSDETRADLAYGTVLPDADPRIDR